MAFDEQKIVALLGLMDGARDKAFLAAAFPEAAESELNEALVNLSLAGRIEMHSDGIRLADASEPLKPSTSSAVDGDDRFWTTSIEVLNLREPVIRNLNRNHIHNIRELLARSEFDLLSLRGMGLKKVNEVREALAEVGLSLGQDASGPAPEMAASLPDADDGPKSINVIEPVALADWVASLKDTHRQVLEMRLQGLKLQQAGEVLGVTRERVRQIEAKNLKRRPRIIEDSYQHLFDTYDIPEDAFCALTGETQQTYYYLKLVSDTKRADRRPMEELLDDDGISEGIKEAFRTSNADPSALYVDGERIEKNKQAIAAHVLHRELAGGPVPLSQLYDTYSEFIQGQGCGDDARLSPGDRRAFSGLLERNQELLIVPSDEYGEGTVVRSYDTTKDFAPLQEALKTFANANAECSTAWLLKQEPVASIARVLDIRTGNELHAVIRRYCEEISGITLGRMPMITLGEADRSEQVLRLAQEMAPVSVTDLADEYERRYGVATPTFKANFMNGVDGIDECLTDGRGARADGGAF